jgi:TatD DNase family protein
MSGLVSHLAGFTSESLPLVRGTALSAIDAARMSYCDIGANLNDEMYDGIYNDKRRHENDLGFVLDRAKSLGVNKIICTAGTVADSENALKMVSGPFGSPFGLYSTAGVHPTRCDEFKEDDSVIKKLQSIVAEGNVEGQPKKIVAIGECGLDYARLKFCSRDQQLIGFQQQLDFAASAKLPMFLHSRDTDGEFLRMMQENIHKLPKGGVVHSFDGSMEEMLALTGLGLHIGINGCSLRTEESLEVVAAIPASRLLLETDAPWCGVKRTHPGFKYVATEFPFVKKKEKWQEGCMVKDRNEPCTIRQVCEIVAALRGVEVEALAAAAWHNTEGLFFS